MSIESFTSQDIIHPELCYLASAAVGFPVSIYRIEIGETTGGPEYQAMRWDESPGPGADFWDWYSCELPQFFPTPELAAATFVEEWRKWKGRAA